MKYLQLCLLTLLFGNGIAQTQIPESGFENWAPNATNIYYEPAGDWWTTLNALAMLGGPVTVSQSTDAHSGQYAALLETKQWGAFLISGLLASGSFIMAEPYIQNGRPFTDKPSKFKGWYKYTPVNGDSAGVGAILTRYNPASGFKDTVATAVKALTSMADSYTQFEIDFNYLMEGVNPDTLIVVFTSSGDGGNFMGQVGSTLLIDDVALEYTAGVEEALFSEFRILASPLPANHTITFDFGKNPPGQLHCRVYSMNGQLMHTFTPGENQHSQDVSTWSEGSYILQAFENNSLLSSVKFVVVH